jgi:hypothetical protein
LDDYGRKPDRYRDEETRSRERQPVRKSRPREETDSRSEVPAGNSKKPTIVIDNSVLNQINDQINSINPVNGRRTSNFP